MKNSPSHTKQIRVEEKRISKSYRGNIVSERKRKSEREKKENIYNSIIIFCCGIFIFFYRIVVRSTIILTDISEAKTTQRQSRHVRRRLLQARPRRPQPPLLPSSSGASPFIRSRRPPLPRRLLPQRREGGGGDGSGGGDLQPDLRQQFACILDDHTARARPRGGDQARGVTGRHCAYEVRPQSSQSKRKRNASRSTCLVLSIRLVIASNRTLKCLFIHFCVMLI